MSSRGLLGVGSTFLAAIGLFAYVVGQPSGPSAGLAQSDAGGRPAAEAAAAAQSSGRGAPGATQGSGRIALAVNEAGFLRPFGNGDQVLTSGPFALRIRFAPYPPIGAADLDIMVVDAEDEHPIEDAALVLRWDMPGHGHGAAPVRVANRGGGHYGLNVNLNMGGDWTFDIDVRQGGQSGRLTMLVSTLGG